MGVFLSGAFGFVDEDNSRRMSFLARAIVKRIGPSRLGAQVLHIVATYIEAWHHPLPRILEIYDYAYQVGMQTGNFEHATIALGVRATMKFIAGLPPLSRVVEDTDSLVRQCQVYKVMANLVMLSCFKEVVHNLSHSCVPQWLECGDDPTLGPSRLMASSEHYKLIWWHFCRMQTAYYFGYDEIALILRSRFYEYKVDDNAFNTTTFGCFFAALIALANVRSATGNIKRQCKTMARRDLRTMHAMVRKRGLNVIHKHYLLEAEYTATLTPDKKLSAESIKQNFNKAIAAATKTGFLQDAALANQRAAQHMLRVGDVFWASHYFTSACNLYQAWGADALVEHLLRERSDYVTKDSLHGPMERMSSTRKSADLLTQRGDAMVSKVNIESITCGTPPEDSSTTFILATRRTSSSDDTSRIYSARLPQTTD